MQCPYPRIASSYGSKIETTYPCGQCKNCLVNNRRKKTGRILLEAKFHLHSSFLTLTQDDDHIEYAFVGSDSLEPTLSPRTPQLFLKRLRHHVPTGTKFCLVGEYGDLYGRPHYHAILFGIEEQHADDIVSKTWRRGHHSVSALSETRAAYVANYCTKKLTKHGHEALEGKHPEFWRASSRPPIGASALPWLRALQRTPGALAQYAETGDVISQVRIGPRTWPLDRWFRDQLRIDFPKTAPSRSGMPYEPVEAYSMAAEKRLARRARRSATGRGILTPGAIH